MTDTSASAGRPRRPRMPPAVAVASCLWVPLILAQGFLLAICVFMIVEAAVALATIPRSGPAAGWVHMILGPIALVTVVLLASEISTVVRMWRGQDAARVGLVVLAILNALLVAVLFVARQPALRWEYEPDGARPAVTLITALAIGVALALIASVAPFHRSATSFFASTTPRPMQ